MDVPVDEPRQDQPTLDVGDRYARVPPRDLGERPEVGDDAVLDDEHPVLDEPGGVRLVTDVLPGVVDQVEERPTDRATGACHRTFSRQVVSRVRVIVDPGADGLLTGEDLPGGHFHPGLSSRTRPALFRRASRPRGAEACIRGSRNHGTQLAQGCGKLHGPSWLGLTPSFTHSHLKNRSSRRTRQRADPEMAKFICKPVWYRLSDLEMPRSSEREVRRKGARAFLFNEGWGCPSTGISGS